MSRANAVDKAFVEKLVREIEDTVRELESLSSKPFEKLDLAERYAIRYCIIVVAEALAALALHIARRALGREPETPTHALAILRDHGLATENEYKDAASLIKLRNLLAHRYGIIDDAKIYRNIKTHGFEAVLRLARRPRAYVEPG